MQLNELLTNETTVWLAEPIDSKKRLLELLSELLAPRINIETKALFEMLLARERLGSTGLGHGIAIPHARVDGLAEPCAALIRLKTGIDFDAQDGQAVDLFCCLLVPSEEPDAHIKILANLAKLFSSSDVQDGLRACEDSRSLYQLALKYASDFS